MKGISGISQKDVDAFRTRYLMYGVDSGSVCRNATLSKIALERVKARFNELVDDLSDGLAIDMDELEALSKDIYIAEDFYRMYNPGL